LLHDSGRGPSSSRREIPPRPGSPSHFGSLLESHSQRETARKSARWNETHHDKALPRAQCAGPRGGPRASPDPPPRDAPGRTGTRSGRVGPSGVLRGPCGGESRVIYPYMVISNRGAWMPCQGCGGTPLPSSGSGGPPCTRPFRREPRRAGRERHRPGSFRPRGCPGAVLGAWACSQ